MTTALPPDLATEPVGEGLDHPNAEPGIDAPRIDPRVEFCMSPREHSEISAKFEVRGNMVRTAASDASVVLADDTHVINFGGTRSGEGTTSGSPSPYSSYSPSV